MKRKMLSIILAAAIASQGGAAVLAADLADAEDLILEDVLDSEEYTADEVSLEEPAAYEEESLLIDEASYDYEDLEYEDDTFADAEISEDEIALSDGEIAAEAAPAEVSAADIAPAEDSLTEAEAAPEAQAVEEEELLTDGTGGIAESAELEDPAIVGLTSGKCGEKTTWSIKDGVLTISGTDAMYDYNLFYDHEEGKYHTDAPWYGENFITQIVISSGVTNIGYAAFAGCDKVSSVNIADSVKSIGEKAFAYCTSLANVTIPDGVPAIGANTFDRCTNLVSVSIPESVKSIEKEAFSYCTSLTSVTIPKGVNYMAEAAFGNCSQLTTINFLGDAPRFEEEDHYVNNVFLNDTASAYYPGTNLTWKESVRLDYGGHITWVPQGKVDVNTLSISLESSTFSYTGMPFTPDVIVKQSGKTLTQNTDYTVTYRNNIEVGKATVTVTGTGKYTGNKSLEFTIEKADISYFTAILSASTFTYDGKNKRPHVDVKDKSGIYLTPGTDFNVVYSNDINAGTAKATIHGKGRNYKGTLTKTYTIKKANQSFTLSHSSITLGVDGTINVSRSGGIGTVTWTPKKSSVAAVEKIAGRYCKVKAVGAGTTDFTVKAAGDGNHNSYSATFKVHVFPRPKLIGAYNGAYGVGIKFTAVKEAEQYVIYRKYLGTWKAIRTVDASSPELQKTGDRLMYTDTTVAKGYGDGFIYSVAAKKGDALSSYDKLGCAIYRLSKVAPKAEKTKDGKAKISWGKVDCNGYEVQYYEVGREYQMWSKSVKTTKLSTVIGGLGKGKTYRFRVRCYKTNADRGTFFSEYSDVISLKL